MLFRSPQLEREGVRVVLDVATSREGGPADGTLYRASVNLIGPRHLSDTVKALQRWAHLLPWQEAIPWAFRTIYDRCTYLGRAVRLVDVPDRPIVYLCEFAQGRSRRGFLLSGDIVGMHGDGGSLKGYAACTMAVAIATGEQVGPWRPLVRTNVLYLDWESRDEVIRRRVRRICEGASLEIPGNIYYRAPRGLPLVGAKPAVLADVDELAIGLVIVDSMAAAIGVDVKAESVMPFFEALRALPSEVATLVIAHVSAASARDDGPGPARAYGSVQVRNQTRLAWEVKKTSVDGAKHTVLLTQEKVNDGPELLEPLGMRVSFTDPEGPVQIEAVTKERAPSLDERYGLRERILEVLVDGSQMSTQQIAREIGAKEAVTRVMLNRLRDSSRVTLLRPGGGRGLQGVWGRAAAR